MSIPRVALLIESSNAYAYGLLKGISDFLQQGGPWSVYLPESGRAEGAAERLQTWEGEGVIVRAEDPKTAAAVAGCACPAVNLSVAGLLPQTPAVHSDVRAEAELAFEHLWERGFRNLGFCGVSDYVWAEWQQERFCELAERSRVKVEKHIAPLHMRQPKDWANERKKLSRWLEELPKPVGIFACYDLLGQQILDACRDQGIRVPDDVAVIGVDNDPVRCGLSHPPLSSVAPDARRVGFLAAELLSSMMAGKKVDPGLRVVPPLGVIARGSTDLLAVHDPEVLAALQFIRQHAHEPIGVKQVVEVVQLSRRALEQRFQRAVGRSPHEQILRCRVDRAKQLLHDTDISIKTIATMVGAGTPEYLSVMFRRLVGISPSSYREGHKTGSARVESAMAEFEQAS